MPNSWGIHPLKIQPPTPPLTPPFQQKTAKTALSRSELLSQVATWGQIISANAEFHPRIFNHQLVANSLGLLKILVLEIQILALLNCQLLHRYRKPLPSYRKPLPHYRNPATNLSISLIPNSPMIVILVLYVQVLINH